MNNEPIRVLQLTYSLKAAGIETFVVNMYKAIDRTRVQFDFVSYFPPSKEEFYDTTVKSLGGKIYKLGYFQRGKIIPNLKTRLNLYHCIKQNGYQLVHIHASSGVSILDAIIAKLAGAKEIAVHSHNSNINQKARYGKIVYLLTKIAQHLWPLCCTDFFACSETAGKWLFSKSTKFSIVCNGVDKEKFSPNKVAAIEWKKAHDIQDNALVIGQVASFTAAKNHTFSLEVFSLVKKNNGNAIMVFIGDGPLRKKIELQVGRLHLEDSVIFTGVTDKVSDWMNACDVLILPSLYEGLPVTCVEAQYAGTPIFVSDRVTREVEVSNEIFFFSIDEGADKWAEELIHVPKKYYKTNIQNTKFDIGQVSRSMLDKYVEMNKCIH